MNKTLRTIKPGCRLFMVLVFTACFAMAFCEGCKKENSPAVKAETSQTNETELMEEQKTEEPEKVVIKSEIAGPWYPDDAKILIEQIGQIFQKAEAKPKDNVIALILPHAGYQYSGQTAAAALKTTNREYKRIIVIGPSHRTPIGGMLSVPKGTHYQTPLGQTPLDVEFINKLLEYPIFQNVQMAHGNQFENAVQIEIPLLQYKYQNFRLVPILTGQCSEKTIEKAASILKAMTDEDTLVIASSDFTHYGRSFGYVPFTQDVPENLKKLDMGAFEYIAKLDCKGFLEYKNKTGATICGAVPIAILLDMLNKDTKAELVKYTTSGQLTGDFSHSVSYLSAAFSGKWKSGPEIEPTTTEDKLSEDEKEILLALARKTIVYYLENKKIPEPADLGITITEPLKEERAAFVTLNKNSMLRGCIGDIFPRQSLYQSVISNAINAAVRDWRFTPVRLSEFNDITIEISALTVPRPVASADDIRIGTDGVVLSKNGRSAVFLPQVAPEQGWGLQETLSQLSLKAGLGADAWKEGAEFLVFQAEVFGEE